MQKVYFHFPSVTEKSTTKLFSDIIKAFYKSLVLLVWLQRFAIRYIEYLELLLCFHMLLPALVQRATVSVDWSFLSNKKTPLGIVNRLKTNLEKQLLSFRTVNRRQWFLFRSMSLYLHDNSSLLFSGILAKHVKPSRWQMFNCTRYTTFRISMLAAFQTSHSSVLTIGRRNVWPVKCDNRQHKTRVLNIRPLLFLSLSLSLQKPIQVRSIICFFTHKFLIWIVSKITWAIRRAI